jgi:7-cyano-7-deazaguanine reductase
MNSNPLGKKTPYSDVFDPEVLFPIERAQSRIQLGIRMPLPFEGIDRWRCYELSWLDAEGVPQLGIATIEYPAHSEWIVESKSLKLFLGSMNFTRYRSAREVEDVITQHLEQRLGTDAVAVSIILPDTWAQCTFQALPGESVDQAQYASGGTVRLRASEEVVQETLHSNLLRSLCPVTAQPDWGSVVIRYKGAKLDHSSLLGYLIAHRSYQGFHEECCERMFVDIVEACNPSELWIGCFYTRRGGIDINPERWIPGSERVDMMGRLVRQ